MSDAPFLRWILVVALVLALVGLLAYARGPQHGIRRSPDRGHLGAFALVHQGT
jgi:hypothetical protein